MKFFRSCGYCLAACLLWLACAATVAPAVSYPFPTTLAFAKAELPKRFGVVTVEQDPDPAIHYKLVMPLQWGQVSGKRQLVTLAHPFELRSHFKALTGPAAEAKISIALVPADMQPDRWLALYLQGQHEKVLHERHIPQVGGAIPDVLSSSGAPGQERISRWIVLKDQAKDGGAHLFMLHVSTAANSYTTDMANVFFVLISNFDLMHPRVQGK
jgi:hypothetical protein